ncbi:MAG: hypothetical protein HYY17_09930 [Planctomycetes bacterium]|nr:hypothetical protein [Planctomycetota bacterium]
MTARIWVVALLVLAGCPGSGPGDDPAPDVRLLDGFGFRWQERPHRINKIGAGLDGAAGVLTLEGGSWADGQEASDAATHSLHHTAFSSDQVVIHHGETPLLTLAGSPSQAATAETQVSVPLAEAGLAACSQFAVVLRGFDLDTDLTHEDGYTTRGIGARVKDASAAEGVLTFTARLRIEAGAVPDRIQDLASYGATGRVRYTVIGLLSGAVTAKSHGYTLSYPAGVDPSQEHATAGQQTVVIQGTPGLAAGAVGLTGFDFRLNPDTSLYPGRYMREISVRDYDFAYASGTGALTFKCDGYFSNSGPVTWALENEFSASFVLIQVASGTVVHQSHEGTQTAVQTWVGLDPQ